jgi:hypothetical protein
MLLEYPIGNALEFGAFGDIPAELFATGGGAEA